jgi:type II secretory pathway pseudopilin PulG
MGHRRTSNNSKDSSRRQQGFTLIELFVVFALIGLSMAVLVIRTGTYSYWRQEAFIRQLSDTLAFLYHQSISDQAFYRIEFDFEKNHYVIGLIKPEYDNSAVNISQDSGNLTLELASIQSPAVSLNHTLIPPPSFPSLGIPVEIPPELKFTDIRTMRGKEIPGEGQNPYILFSPRGFSEFAVLHLETYEREALTILINPFSGNTTIYREYKDFEWTHGKDQEKN